MKRIHLALFCLLTPFAAVALPHQDGAVTVGERAFYVGEIPSKFDSDDARSFPLRFSPWLEGLLENDPELSRYDVRFFRSGRGVPAIELVEESPWGNRRERMVLEDDPSYMAEGYDVFTVDDLSMYIHPQDSDMRYSIFCTRSLTPGELNLCTIRLAYPHGTHVVVTARQYSPGKLPEISDNFEAIAARMLEIATCLDVTELADVERQERGTELETQNSDLSGCRILLSS